MDLLLIGGVSGSGKSVALGALEDSGYYAVNNLPLPLVAETAALSRERRTRPRRDRARRQDRAGPRRPRRTRSRACAPLGWNVRFLYLDAKTETLVKRFSETRRRHPFSSDARTLTEAIDYERALLADVRPLGFAFDTSELLVGRAARLDQGLRQRRRDASSRCCSSRSASSTACRSTPTWSSTSAASPNPHYEPALQPLTGRDPPVVAFLEKDARRRADVRRHPSLRRAAGFPTTRATTATT